jgi:sugar lactone lactonase YvrE
MQTREPQPVAGPLSTLGEGVLWDHRRDVLWWVDVRSPAVHGLDWATGAVRSFQMPEVVAALVLRRGGGLLACLRSGLWSLDPDTGAVAPFLNRPDDRAGSRLNDTTVDARGRIWTTTMWDFAREKTGRVYRIDAHRSVTDVRGPYWITNGLCFAPDRRTMYFSDTVEGRIIAFPFDLETGSLGEPRLFAGPDAAPGHPDGSTIDAEGYLWSARFGAGAVARFSPDGRLDKVVEVPATQVTSCGFGGRNLDTLYVATGTQGLAQERLKSQIHAGALFAVPLDVPGLPENEYVG